MCLYESSKVIYRSAFRNKLLLQLSEEASKYQAKMIAAVTVLALMSLLVATDSEPTGVDIPKFPRPPLRPGKRVVDNKPLPTPNRLAA